jgi:hypothetical protein
MLMKSTKIALALTAAVVLLATPITSSSVYAAQKVNTATAAKEVRVIIDGKVQSFEQSAIVLNGSTLVPMRGIFEALGAKITWKADTSTVTATKDGTSIIIQIGSKTATINGKAVTLAAPATIINGSTMVPLRFVSEALGSGVKWDGKTNTATIKSAGAATPAHVSSTTSTDAMISKSPVQVRVHYKPNSTYPEAFIPSFTMSYRDSKGVAISTVTADKSNYNVEEGFYLLDFPTKTGYTLGEKYQLMIEEVDPLVTQIEFYNHYFDEEDNRIREEAYTKVGQYYEFTVRSMTRYIDEWEIKTETVLVPSAPSDPISAILKTDEKAVVFIFKKPDGTLLKNMPVSLHVKAGKITLKTDENGRVRVDTTKVSTDFSITSEGYEFKALGHNGEEYRTVDLSLSKPAGVTPGLQDKALIYTVIAIES